MFVAWLLTSCTQLHLVALYSQSAPSSPSSHNKTVFVSIVSFTLTPKMTCFDAVNKIAVPCLVSISHSTKVSRCPTSTASAPYQISS